VIQLVGPGGAGKTTIGAALAERLGVRFVDLDAEFAARYGNISAYLDAHGYAAYAEQNVGVYLDLVGGHVRVDIVALSSGFMTYRASIHPYYLALRQRVALSPSTFVLLPSTDLETCVNEILRRQLQRAFARSAAREEEVIRERFSTYFGLPARKVETMQPIEAVVAELVMALAAQQAAAPDGTGPARARPSRSVYRESRVPQVSGRRQAADQASNMATYYCGPCRLALGYAPSLSSGPLLQTGAQQAKHVKHTLVDPSERLQSVFSDPSTATIRVEVENALGSGAMEVDDRGRINFLTWSGEGVGYRYESGTQIEEQDLTKVVLSSNAGQRHQFTEATARLGSQRCQRCGGELFQPST